MAETLRVRSIEESDQEIVREVLIQRWDSHQITSRGKVLDGTKLAGFIVETVDHRVCGLITVNIQGDECEVVTIDALEPHLGIGTRLLEAACEYASSRACRRLWLVTTNDNLNALRFYQRRGMRLVKLHPGAIDHARQYLKPEIPLVGEHGIAIRDEIEFEVKLDAG